MAQFRGPCQRNRHARTRTGKHRNEDREARGLPCRRRLGHLFVPEDHHRRGHHRLVRVQREPPQGHDRGDPRRRRRAHRPGSARRRPHRRDAVRPVAADGGRAHIARHRRDRECLPRHQGQGARRSGLRAVRRRAARPDAGLLVALRGPARALRRHVRRQGDRPAGGAQPRRSQRGPPARRASAASRRSRPTCCCSTPRAGGSSPRAWLVPASAIPSSISPTTSSTR